MAYDRLAESVALIEAGRAEPVARLSRRRRFAAMAVDVAGDIAVTMFARRGVGRIWQETHVLALRDGQWTWLGSGGSDGDQDLLAERPEVLPWFLGLRRASGLGADPRVMAIGGSGGVLDDGDGADRSHQSGRWISYAALRVTARVMSVQVDERLLAVPWHGHVVMVWSEQPPPRVVALDAVGTPLAEMRGASTR